MDQHVDTASLLLGQLGGMATEPLWFSARDLDLNYRMGSLPYDEASPAMLLNGKLFDCLTTRLLSGQPSGLTLEDFS